MSHGKDRVLKNEIHSYKKKPENYDLAKSC